METRNLRTLVKIFVLAVALVVAAVSPGRDANVDVDAPIKALFERIEELVKGLKYSDKVGKDFAKMVLGWKDAEGNRLWDDSKDRLDQAKEKYRQGKISKRQLAQIELDIIRRLIKKIKGEFTYEKGAFDLTVITKSKRANCLGYTQMMFILGNALGISVETLGAKIDERIAGLMWEKGVAKPLYFADSMKPSTLAGHVVCLVNLTDAKKAIVDLASNIELKGPFEFKEVYKKRGIYWEPVESDKTSMFYVRIRQLDKKGLITHIRIQKARSYWRSNEYEKLIASLNECTNLDTENALVYFDRAEVYSKLGKFTEAHSDYRKAIDLDPEFVQAYNGLGELYARAGKYKEAIGAYRQALSFDFNFGQAHLNLAEAAFELGNYKGALLSYDFAKVKLRAKKFVSGQESVSQSVIGYIHYKTGLSWYRLKIYYEAELEFATARELDPTLKSNIDEILKLIQAERLENIKQLSPSDIPELITQAKNKDFTIRFNALESLVNLGQPSVPALIRVLGDKEVISGIRYGIAYALAVIGPLTEDVVPALIKLLEDPTFDNDFVVERALLYIGEPAIPEFKKASKSEKERLRRNVKKILENLEAKKKAA